MGIGPFVLEGPFEALHFSMGLWSVGLGELLFDAGGNEFGGEVLGPVAGAIICKHPLDGDARSWRRTPRPASRARWRSCPIRRCGSLSRPTDCGRRWPSGCRRSRGAACHLYYSPGCPPSLHPTATAFGALGLLLHVDVTNSPGWVVSIRRMTGRPRGRGRTVGRIRLPAPMNRRSLGCYGTFSPCPPHPSAGTWNGRASSKPECQGGRRG